MGQAVKRLLSGTVTIASTSRQSPKPVSEFRSAARTREDIHAHVPHLVQPMSTIAAAMARTMKRYFSLNRRSTAT
jgi:hypothetical protein